MITSNKQKRQPGRAGASKTALANDCASNSTADSAAIQRDQLLAKILKEIPGNTSSNQRARLMAAMLALGSITSREGSRCLDCYDPRARIHELRNQGQQITTAIRNEVTAGGAIRRVGVYILKGGEE